MGLQRVTNTLTLTVYLSPCLSLVGTQVLPPGLGEGVLSHMALTRLPPLTLTALHASWHKGRSLQVAEHGAGVELLSPKLLGDSCVPE